MVRLARELRGLTQTALAKKASLPQARLSRIEAGQLEATSGEIEALSNALELPAAFLVEAGAPAAVPLFRKRVIRSGRLMATVQARLNTAVLVARRVLDAGIEIEAAQFFPEPGHFDPANPSLAASELRRDWRLPIGRVDDVVGVIEAAGGIVLPVDFGTSDATAAFLSTPADGRTWFLVNTRETAGDRIRLSLAHELGHAVLHRMVPTIDERETELQAFVFAAAFLLPAEQFDRAVPFDALTLTHARHLKRTFGVSMQAIIRAAFVRGRISQARYTSLYKQLSARQWRTQEPDAIPIEPVHTWTEAIRIHREQHGYSDSELAAIARVSDSLLAELFPENFRYRPPLRVAGGSPRVTSMSDRLRSDSA
jgi:Zn-dependent peptidase ImmA (M78 family)